MRSLEQERQMPVSRAPKPVGLTRRRALDDYTNPPSTPPSRPRRRTGPVTSSDAGGIGLATMPVGDRVERQPFAGPDVPKRRREEARRRFDGLAGATGGGIRRPGRWKRGSVRAGWPSVHPAEPPGPPEFTQEEELIDLAKRPVRALDRDAAHERRQVGGFLRRQSEGRQGPVRPARRGGRHRVERRRPTG